MIIDVLCRSTRKREGTWHHGYAHHDADPHDVVRATLLDAGRVISVEVMSTVARTIG